MSPESKDQVSSHARICTDSVDDSVINDLSDTKQN